MATGYEIEAYQNLGRIARALDKIADALERLADSSGAT